MLGIEAKVYYRSGGTWGAPTWTEVDAISDFTPNETWDVAEILIRRSRVKHGAKTTLDLSFTGKLLIEPANAVYLEILETVRSPDDTIDLMILNGANDENGVVGVRGNYQLTSNSDSQNPGDVQYIQFNGQPYPVVDEAPQYVEVAGGVPVFTTI